MNTKIASEVMSNSLPVATTSEAGIVKIGSGLSVDENGVLSSTGGGESGNIPIATSSTLGGVIPSHGLSVSETGKLTVKKLSSSGLVVNSQGLTYGSGNSFEITNVNTVEVPSFGYCNPQMVEGSVPTGIETTEAAVITYMSRGGSGTTVQFMHDGTKSYVRNQSVGGVWSKWMPITGLDYPPVPNEGSNVARPIGFYGIEVVWRVATRGRLGSTLNTNNTIANLTNYNIKDILNISGTFVTADTGVRLPLPYAQNSNYVTIGVSSDMNLYENHSLDLHNNSTYYIFVDFIKN